MFYESDVQFTGGALGQGVSEMRTYLLKGSSAVGEFFKYGFSSSTNHLIHLMN